MRCAGRMTSTHLSLTTDLPGALRRLHQPPALPRPTITLRPCRTATALVDAAAAWQRRCADAATAITTQLQQLEHFAVSLVDEDRRTATALGGWR